MSDVDKYLEKHANPSQRAELEKIRKLVKQIVPQAEELISYGIPAFKYNKQPLIYIASFKGHMSLFPASDDMVKAIKEVEKYRTSKGTLQFTEDNVIPVGVLEKIIAHRLRSISKKK